MTVVQLTAVAGTLLSLPYPDWSLGPTQPLWGVKLITGIYNALASPPPVNLHGDDIILKSGVSKLGATPCMTLLCGD
jgi:hypothetical protein